MEAKKALRNQVKAAAVDRRPEKDAAVLRHIVSLGRYENANAVFFYMPAGNEPDITPLVKQAISRGKRVFVPVIHDDTMEFAEVFENTVFVIRKFGIREPEVLVYSDVKPDIMIVPGVAFDKNKNRLGHGKGYYDKYLFGLAVCKIGVTYSDFLVDTVYPEAHDIMMDAVITDKEMIE